MPRTAEILGLLLVFAASCFSRPGPISPCDLNQDGATNVADVQAIVKEALGATSAVHDLNGDGSVNLIDVEIVVNGALNLGCGTAGSSPALLSVTPASGVQGQDLFIAVIGANTHFSASTSLVVGTGITVVSATASSTTNLKVEIMIAADVSPGAYNLTVTTASESVSAAGAFTVLPAVTTPAIVSVSPSSVSAGSQPTVTVTGIYTHFQQGVTTLNLGQDIAVQSVLVAGPTSLQAVLTVPSIALPGSRTLSVSTGPENATLIQGLSIAGSDITITSPADGAYVLANTVQVAGMVGDPAAVITVNGVVAVNSSGSFNATVPLVEGSNTITAQSQSAGGAISSATIRVTLDLTPPRVTILNPRAGAETTEASITVSGMVNDIVLGTVNDIDATVTVNGVNAQVANRTFMVSGVNLSAGVNNLSVTATDRAGNSSTTNVSVTRVMNPLVTLQVLSGNNQSGSVLALLPNPLVVRLLNSSGQPMANQPVNFQVTANDAMVASLPGSTPATAVQVTTDSQGRAQAYAQLGTRAGSGNNQVEAFSTGVTTPAVFSLSGASTTPAMLLADSGQNQTGTAGELLAFPFVIVATDPGFNRLPNIPVTFTVISGNGDLGGASTVIASTDSNGRAAITLRLGGVQGNNNNVVVATIGNQQVQPAVFSASALAPGASSSTSISGLVLANNGDPIAGAIVHLLLTNQGTTTNLPMDVAPTSPTNAQGQFLMPTVPAGLYKLMVDGTTASGPNQYPTLEFDITTVVGQQNSVGAPIYLPALDQVNKLCVTATTGGTLLVPAIPGFALTVAAGSATFPGGSKSGCVSVTPVNLDKIPMAPGFGQQPRFVVTIQPVGTSFNPPASLAIPNVDGLAPRAVTEMYSYDHDLGAFVSIGTGTVSVDGRAIQSDPGVGVVKAGWHCGGNPATSGAAGQCKDCYTCLGQGCVVNPGATTCDDHDYCTSCNGTGAGGDCCVGGKCQGKRWGDEPFGDVSFSFGPEAHNFFDLGSELLNALTPCTLELQFADSFKAETGNYCCNNPQGSVAATKISGSLTATLTGSCFEGVVIGLPTWVPVENHFVGKAGLTYSIDLGGSVGAEGTVQTVCKDCTAKLSGSVTVGFGIGVEVEVAGGVLGITCGVHADGASIGGSYNICTGEFERDPVCAGPVDLTCSVEIAGFFDIDVAIELAPKKCF